jgi:translation initiation factor eIF-2B subunit gamma
VDTAPLLLMISLQLAKLDAIDQVGRQEASPFAHASKVAYPGGIAGRCTVTRQDCLIADNVTVEERSAVKECVIGANCQVGEGAKLFRCVLMEGVVVGKGCKISGSILGRRSVVGNDSVLQDCEVEDNMRIEAQSKFFLSLRLRSGSLYTWPYPLTITQQLRQRTRSSGVLKAWKRLKRN